MKCPCCDHQFTDAEGRSTCTACVAKSGCGLLRCPTCGFESAREPRIVDRLRHAFHAVKWRLGGRRTPPDPACTPSMALSDLHRGEEAVVEMFGELHSVRKFLSLGILPGTIVQVLRASPGVVVRVGYSEFAFDRALASTVKVKRLSARHRP